MTDSNGNELEVAGPSMPVEIVGCKILVGDFFKAFKDENKHAIGTNVNKHVLKKRDNQVLNLDDLSHKLRKEICKILIW